VGLSTQHDSEKCGEKSLKGRKWTMTNVILRMMTTRTIMKTKTRRKPGRKSLILISRVKVKMTKTLKNCMCTLKQVTEIVTRTTIWSAACSMTPTTQATRISGIWPAQMTQRPRNTSGLMEVTGRSVVMMKKRRNYSVYYTSEMTNIGCSVPATKTLDVSSGHPMQHLQVGLMEQFPSTEFLMRKRTKNMELIVKILSMPIWRRKRFWMDMTMRTTTLVQRRTRNFYLVGVVNSEGQKCEINYQN